MITSCSNIRYNSNNSANLSFNGRLVPARLSRFYENAGFKGVLSPIMDYKARKYPQVIRKTLAPIIKKVQIPSKNGSIYSWEVNPENSKKYVLFLHGIKGKSTIPPNQLFIESVIQKGGYGIITPEYRGSAELHKKNFTFKNIIEDAQATLDYLYSKGIKPEDITIVSHCIGSIPASHIAAKEKNIGKIILVSPIVDGGGFGTTLLKTLKLKLPNFLENKLNTFIELFMPYEMNTVKQINATNSPITVILPTNDSLVSNEQCSKLIKFIRNLNNFITIPNGIHALTKSNCSTIIEQL